MFDRDALLENLKHVGIWRIGGENNEKEVKEGAVLRIDQWDEAMTTMSQANISTSESDNGTNKLNSLANQADTITKGISAASTPHYDDEIPPFDITVSFANEYGQNAVLVIYGVEILNEGTGFSIDNVTSEKACTFVARRVEHMKPVYRNSQTSAGDNKSK